MPGTLSSAQLQRLGENVTPTNWCYRRDDFTKRGSVWCQKTRVSGRWDERESSARLFVLGWHYNVTSSVHTGKRWNVCVWKGTCCRERWKENWTMHIYRESSDYFSVRLSVHKGRGAWRCRHDGTMGALTQRVCLMPGTLECACVCVLKGTGCWRSDSGGNLTNGGYKMVSNMMTVGPPTQWQARELSNISTTLGGVKNNEHLQHKALAHKKT